MPISFNKLGQVLKDKNKTFYSLRKDKIVGTATIKKLQEDNGNIDTRTIEKLCKYLDCKIEDIMEYVKE